MLFCTINEFSIYEEDKHLKHGKKTVDVDILKVVEKKKKL